MTNNSVTEPASTTPPDDLSRNLTLVGALAGDIYTLLFTGNDSSKSKPVHVLGTSPAAEQDAVFLAVKTSAWSRTSKPPVLDEAAKAAIGVKAKALAPDYAMELL